MARRRQARLEVEAGGRNVPHAPAREIQAAGEETRVAKILPPVLCEEFLNSFIDNESVHTIHIYIHK